RRAAGLRGAVPVHADVAATAACGDGVRDVAGDRPCGGRLLPLAAAGRDPVARSGPIAPRVATGRVVETVDAQAPCATADARADPRVDRRPGPRAPRAVPD